MPHKAMAMAMTVASGQRNKLKQGQETCRGDVHGCDVDSDVNSKIITIKIKSSKNQKRESKAAN